MADRRIEQAATDTETAQRRIDPHRADVANARGVALRRREPKALAATSHDEHLEVFSLSRALRAALPVRVVVRTRRFCRWRERVRRLGQRRYPQPLQVAPLFGRLAERCRFTA